MQLRCGLLSITTPVSHLANEFDVRNELHGQVSWAAVNQILCGSWGYEVLQNSKDSLKACFENVNILVIYVEPNGAMTLNKVDLSAEAIHMGFLPIC